MSWKSNVRFPVVGIVGGVAMVAVASLLWSCSGWGTPSASCLAGAQLDESGQCRAQDAPNHHIPFRPGFQARVTQAYHGYNTHRDGLAYAVDFACAKGTPITASQSGVVWSARRDSDRGCDDEECKDDANYVIIDHGDGTFSTYYHLQLKGAIVEAGEQVCRGQVIGLCGATGYATGPHLHFAVRGPDWRTIPIRFAELEDKPAVAPLVRSTYESRNRRVTDCEDTDYSTLGLDAFVHRGVMLDEEIPMTITADGDRTTRIEGRVLSEKPNVSIHRRNVDNGDWIQMCREVDDDGAFSFEIDWPERIFEDGYYFLMVTETNEECRTPGWAWAYRIRVRNHEP